MAVSPALAVSLVTTTIFVFVIIVVVVFGCARGATTLDVKLVVKISDGLAAAIVDQELSRIEWSIVGAGKTARPGPTSPGTSGAL